MIKREDVIIDPTDPRVEGLIGKKVFFGDIFSRIQKQEQIGVLTDVIEKSDFPFMSKNFISAMIAPVPEPTYRPFKSADEFAPYRDKWVQLRGCSKIFRIDTYSDIGGSYQGNFVLWEILFKILILEDGTPFGVKENN